MRDDEPRPVWMSLPITHVRRPFALINLIGVKKRAQNQLCFLKVVTSSKIRNPLMQATGGGAGVQRMIGA